MKLTAKQEKFAQSLAGGLNQSDAYRQVYRTDRMKPETIYKRASELSKNRKVAGMVQELKKELADKELWTREDSVKGLIATYKMAKAIKNPNAMTGAIKELNAMHGFNEPNKIDLTSGGEKIQFNNMTAIEAAEAYQELMKK